MYCFANASQGTPISGAVAAEWGLACAVVEPDQLMNKVFPWTCYPDVHLDACSATSWQLLAMPISHGFCSCSIATCLQMPEPVLFDDRTLYP